MFCLLHSCAEQIRMALNNFALDNNIDDIEAFDVLSSEDFFSDSRVKDSALLFMFNVLHLCEYSCDYTGAEGDSFPSGTGPFKLWMANLNLVPDFGASADEIKGGSIKVILFFTALA